MEWRVFFSLSIFIHLPFFSDIRKTPLAGFTPEMTLVLMCELFLYSAFGHKKTPDISEVDLFPKAPFFFFYVTIFDSFLT